MTILETKPHQTAKTYEACKATRAFLSFKLGEILHFFVWFLDSCFYSNHVFTPSALINFNSSCKKRACCGIRICQVWQRGFLNAASGPTSSRCQEIIKSCFLLVCSYLYFSKSSRPISSETVWSSWVK